MNLHSIMRKHEVIKQTSNIENIFNFDKFSEEKTKHIKGISIASSGHYYFKWTHQGKPH